MLFQLLIEGFKILMKFIIFFHDFSVNDHIDLKALLKTEVDSAINGKQVDFCTFSHLNSHLHKEHPFFSVASFLLWTIQRITINAESS